MEKVKVIKHSMYRDGGTCEYRDKNNRTYYTLSPFRKDNRVFQDIPPIRWMKGDEGYEDMVITGLELEIVDHF